MSEIDEEALADAYNTALEDEKAGRLEAAAAGYRKVLEIDPEDRGGASVRLAAIGHGETPEKAPDAYVATLFDQHAEVFESILVDQLGYCVPLLLRALLDRLEIGPFDRVLDLGCGTGLAADALRDRAVEIVGVDLSESMLDIAYDKDVYDELYAGEAVAFLTEPPDEKPYDLIVATDVIPYLGHLEAFAEGAAACLIDGGYLSFSTETLPANYLAGAAFKVGHGQRFGHAEAYVHDTLAANGFVRIASEPISVRSQDGEPVPGHLVLVRLETRK